MKNKKGCGCGEQNKANNANENETKNAKNSAKKSSDTKNCG